MLRELDEAHEEITNLQQANAEMFDAFQEQLEDIEAGESSVPTTSREAELKPTTQVKRESSPEKPESDMMTAVQAAMQEQAGHDGAKLKLEAEMRMVTAQLHEAQQVVAEQRGQLTRLETNIEAAEEARRTIQQEREREKLDLTSEIETAEQRAAVAEGTIEEPTTWRPALSISSRSQLRRIHDTMRWRL